MSAEAIARVVEELNRGQLRPAPAGEKWDTDDTEADFIAWAYDTVGSQAPALIAYAQAHGRLAAVLKMMAIQVSDLWLMEKPVIVDATSIMRSVIDGNKDVAIYEKMVAPPWQTSAFCMENLYGNVYVVFDFVVDPKVEEYDRWETAEPIDWDAVKWIHHAMILLGGRSTTHNEHVPVTGPLYDWYVAVGADGYPMDIHWRDRTSAITKANEEAIGATRGQMENILVGWLSALDFLNCRNVEIREPRRPRAERRRIERTGVHVNEIVVRPQGSSSRSRGSGDGFVPLTTVRGHHAHYGACCPHHEPRGLLFGKYEGRYWIPPHARGDAKYGENKNTYRLEPGD